MPAISKIRFTNVVYENGEKRYNDDIFDYLKMAEEKLFLFKQRCKQYFQILKWQIER